jgi:ATP-dependent protease HslVU (ClpYQ) peptidase subunit
MTCIVGVIEKETVTIGGDSAGVRGLDVWVRKDPKVFKVGAFVIGCTTSFRMTQLIRFSFAPPEVPEGEDVFKYMCTAFVDALRTCFKNGGFMTVSNSVESGGAFLVGYKNRLFSVESDFQVTESFDGFEAVGCGESFALGALCAMDSGTPAADRVQKALEIAAYRSGGVRPPFIIEST